MAALAFFCLHFQLNREVFFFKSMISADFPEFYLNLLLFKLVRSSIVLNFRGSRWLVLVFGFSMGFIGV